jgi:hypothetical protein
VVSAALGFWGAPRDVVPETIEACRRVRPRHSRQQAQPAARRSCRPNPLPLKGGVMIEPNQQDKEFLM